MINAKVDVSDFNLILKDYLKFSKREIAEVLNTKMYYILCGATQDIKKIESPAIESDLRGPSKVNPTAPLAAILVNTSRKRSGKRGLFGAKMKTAIEKFIAAKKRTSAYLASTPIGSIREFAPYVRRKMGYKADTRTKQRGTPKSMGYPVRDMNKSTMTASTIIKIKDKKNNSRVMAVLTEGIQRAFNRETKSMVEYISRQLDKYKG